LPTPITHLVIAKEIWNSRSAAFPQTDDAALAAFLLGSTVADSRVITGSPRAATHFLDLPPKSPESGVRGVLSAYPELSAIENLAPCGRLLVGGYLAHLLADEIWLIRIFWPRFTSPTGPHSREVLLRHDLLRTLVDQMDRAKVPAYYRDALQHYECTNPLPFLTNVELETWRRLLLRELEAPDSSPTQKHFAGRYGLSASEFVALLESERYPGGEIWQTVSPAEIERYHEESAEAGGQLLEAYLSGQVDRFAFPPLTFDKHAAHIHPKEGPRE
jgi:hypothetical protein